jgi:hypothetical protein
MNLRVTLVLLCVATLAQSKSHSGMPRACSSDTRAGQTCTLPAAAARPTQLILGMQEVRAKTAKFSDMSVSDLQDYTIENPVPCVAGPGGTFHMTDHHHLTASVLASSHKEGDKNVVVLVQDTSLVGSASMIDFYEGMVKLNAVWLTDEKGHGPINPLLLPNSVTHLANDPYRSLAYNVRKAGGYDKVTTPYQDFLWGDFFRSHDLIELPTDSSNSGSFCAAAPYSTLCLGGASAADDIINAAQDAAMQLAASHSASSLPGYKTSGFEVSDEAEHTTAEAGQPATLPASATSLRTAVTAVVGALVGVALFAGMLMIGLRIRRRRSRDSIQGVSSVSAASLLALATASQRYDLSSEADQAV